MFLDITGWKPSACIGGDCRGPILRRGKGNAEARASRRSSLMWECLRNVAGRVGDRGWRRCHCGRSGGVTSRGSSGNRLGRQINLMYRFISNFTATQLQPYPGLLNHELETNIMSNSYLASHLPRAKYRQSL